MQARARPPAARSPPCYKPTPPRARAGPCEAAAPLAAARRRGRRAAAATATFMIQTPQSARRPSPPPPSAARAAPPRARGRSLPLCAFPASSARPTFPPAGLRGFARLRFGTSAVAVASPARAAAPAARIASRAAPLPSCCVCLFVARPARCTVIGGVFELRMAVWGTPGGWAVCVVSGGGVWRRQGRRQIRPRARALAAAASAQRRGRGSQRRGARPGRARQRAGIRRACARALRAPTGQRVIESTVTW